MDGKDKVAIITGFIEGDFHKILPDPENYYIVCADSGYKHAFNAGVKPDLIIGDFDSYKGTLPDDVPVERLPVEKDDTDTGMCTKMMLDRGFRDITIVGGLGGRFDHTFSNVQTASNACKMGAKIWVKEERNEITVIQNSSITIPRRDFNKMGVFALSEYAEGVTIKGAYYEVEDIQLNRYYPVGCSNETTDQEEIFIEVKEGSLLIVMARE